MNTTGRNHRCLCGSGKKCKHGCAAQAAELARLGYTQLQQGQLDASEHSFQQALLLQPDFVNALLSLGTVYWLKQDHAAVIDCCRRVLAIEPDNIAAANNLVVSGTVLKQFDDVATYALKIIALDPNHSLSYFHLALACQEQGNLAAGVSFYERAAALNPQHADSHFGRSMLMLAMGQLEQGWQGYEFRWHCETRPVPWRDFPYPRWQGESLAGKTLLVWGEQGIGDQIMFASLYNDVLTVAPDCIFACSKKLLPLFQRSFPQARVLDLDDSDALAPYREQIGLQSPAGSLARWLRPTQESFAANRPFLQPDPQRVSYWRARLAQLGPGLKVGIGWRSGNLSGDRAFFCTRLEQWGPILTQPGVRFINLQYDECAGELEQVRQLFGVDVHAFAEVDLFDDLAEAAALTSALDLVISAPTTTAILAAALGVPTWQMVSGFDWQNMGSDKNLWYLSLRSFNKDWEQNWSVLVDEVAVCLQQQVEADYVLGMEAFKAQQYPQAEILLRKTLANNPANVTCLVNLGVVLNELGQFAQTQMIQRQALALEPDNAAAWFNLAVAQVASGDIDAGMQSYARVLEINPQLKQAYFNLGTTFRLQGDHGVAVQCYLRALDIDGNYLAACNNLAESYLFLKKFAAVAEYALKTIALDPANANGYFHLAVACQEQDDLPASLQFHAQAVSLNPHNQNIRCSQGLALLADGQLVAGWQGYEARWYKESAPEPLRYFPYPCWQGESLTGKTLLVWGEQGIGDQIMFASMYAELIAQAKLCIFACTAKLLPLLTLSFPKAHIIALDDAEQLASLTIDVQSAAGSVARWLRRDASSFPQQVHFLQADPARVHHWRTQLAQSGTELKVGICWRSGNMTGDRGAYCTSLSQWGTLLGLSGVRFINLQYDDCQQELALAQTQFGVSIDVMQEVDLYHDLAESAALIQALDLVISAPNTTAILAGALAVPTWQMVCGFDWQVLGTAETRWYSSVRSFRKNWDQDWECMMVSMAQQLTDLVNKNNYSEVQG